MENKFPTVYDKEIKENLPHLNNYPEMLPFIGTNYGKMKSKIFILGESHYIDKLVINKLNAISVKSPLNVTGDNRFLTDWYNQNSSEFDKDTSGWLFTRGNIDGIEVNSINNKTIRFYWNLRKELESNVELIDSKNVFSNFVYYNYFQRPALVDGGSIANDSIDNEKAYETLRYMAEKFNPHKIIFATIKGWDAFYKIRKSPSIFDEINVDFVPHASCKWWNTPSQKYGNRENPKMKGKEKFIFLLKK